MMSAPARANDASISSTMRPRRSSRRGGCFHHRVLAADVVDRHRHVNRSRSADEIHVRERRLDHQDVGALGDVELHFAQRLAAVGGVHLVRSAVAEAGVESAASRNGP